MYINRAYEKAIAEKLNRSGKIIIVYGTRQLGKTTLVEHILSHLELKTLSVNADQQKYIDVLSSRDLNKLRSLIHGYDLLFIDEAQRIPDIGINLKILTDEMPELKVIASGSSSFDLANKISEPLTGRKWVFTLYPISVIELHKIYNRFEINNKLEELLIYGGYPEVVTTINNNEKRELLEEIGRSYLYKDIIELTNLKYQFKIKDLLRLLAFQIGSEVSINELCNNLDMNRETVERYINLLEKTYVIFRLPGFSRNLRKEVKKMDKYYFYDLGIRNYIIDNFKSLKDRNDIGALWENFIISERKKYLSYNKIYASTYFWRTYTGAELDYIEERDGKLLGYEIKYKKTNLRPPKTWSETYQNSEYKLINKENYLDFIS